MKKITKIFTTLSLVALLGSCSLSNLRYKEVSYMTFKEKALATAENAKNLEEFTEIEAKVKVEKKVQKLNQQFVSQKMIRETKELKRNKSL